MAESQKTAAPSVKSKEKNSLLDIDMDKDLFGSWKSADNGMDFDFGPPTTTGGKKTAFKFDKMDMDFSFDTDFGKSFKLDMPGFDLSSQESEKSKDKSTEKSKEKSKEKPSGGEQRAKRDSFQFDFDFNEFGNLDFESKKTKVDGKSNKSKDKEECSNVSGSEGSGDLFTKNFDTSQDSDPTSRGPSDFESNKTKVNGKSNKSKDKEECSNVSGSEGSGDLFTKNFDTSQDSDISFKPPASRGPSDLEVDIKMDHDKDPDPRNEENNLKTVIDESCHLKPANAEEQEIQTALSSEKIISSSLQEPIQESQSPERRSSPEHHAQPVAQDVYGHALADNVSTDETFSDVQEEETSTMDRMASPSSGDARNDNVRPVAESVPRSLSVENSLAHTNLQIQKDEMSETRDDNPVISHIDGDDTRKADSYPENSETPGIQNSALGETVKRNADSFSKPHVDSLDGGNKIDKLVSAKERGSIPIRSKYFKKQDGSDSELQQASVSSTKLISMGNKRMSTLPNNPALEKRSGESGSKVTAISRPPPKVLSRDIPKQTENTERGQVKGHETTREGLNANNTKPKNERMKTTVTHDTGPTMEESVSRGNDQKSEHINAIRSDVHAANSIEQSKKILPQISLNTGLQATNMTSTRNVRKIVVEKNRIPPTTVEMKKSEVSSLRVSRVTEPKLKPLSSLLPKNSTSMRNKEQGTELQANLMLKRNPSVDTENQTPLPTTLKRKASEESAAIRRLAPLKRPSSSPSNSVRALPQKVVEEQVCNHASVAHDKSPRINAPQTEMDITMANDKSPRFDVSQIGMDISSSVDDDSIAEKAEACSKELEDICNMLKEKHEEAKDLLVRAIVNNNNIAMLNHPVFQDKIRMVQKFAELLISK